MMLDLDYYKRINDTYGHDVGDQALRQITQLCQENVREVDILARYGGDEFIILLPETNLEEAADIAERLRCNMEASQIEIDSIPISTTLSIGVAGTADRHTEFNELLKWADIALYKAKQAGKNRVHIRNFPTTPKKETGDTQCLKSPLC
jgi:diguanylate cyclase (GGDEF)-like protein